MIIINKTSIPGTHLSKAVLLITLLIYVLFFSTSVNAITLKAETDKTSMTRTETLNLIIVVDENTNSDIDFTQLSYQFDVVSSQKSSRITISNGKKVAKTFWVLALAPKETGKLTIPAFNYKNTFSSSITINVTEQVGTTSTNFGSPDIFFEVITDKKAAYVQEQILVTARLYYKIALSNYEHGGLKVSNARVEQVHEENSDVTFRGQRYKLLEEVYAVHPQASGKLKIPVQTWRLEKPGRRFGYSNPTNPYVYASSEELTLDVLPIPDSKTSDSDWLPSKNVALIARWKQSPLQAIIGEPLNLQIEISAQGLADYQLPDMAISESANFTIFEAQPETNNIKNRQGLNGIRKLNYSIIPRVAGEFKLPQISISWWNVDTDKEDMFILPEQGVVVAKSSITTSLMEPNQNLPEPNVLTFDAARNSTSVILWQVISSLFLVIICALMYSIYKVKKAALTLKNNNVGSPYSLLGSKQKSIINRIEVSIEHKDWQQFRKDIINWGQLNFNDKTLDTLGQLTLYLPELAAQLNQLDNYLYGQQSGTDYNPHTLFCFIKEYKRSVQVNKPKVLKKIYR